MAKSPNSIRGLVVGLLLTAVPAGAFGNGPARPGLSPNEPTVAGNSKTPASVPTDLATVIAATLRDAPYEAVAVAGQGDAHKSANGSGVGVMRAGHQAQVQAANPAHGFDAAFNADAVVISSKPAKRPSASTSEPPAFHPSPRPALDVAQQCPGAAMSRAAGAVSTTPVTGKGSRSIGSSWRLTLSPRLIGYAGHMKSIGAAQPQADRTRISYARGLVTEWYDNSRRGLKQNFTIHRPPRHTGHIPAAGRAAAPTELGLMGATGGLPASARAGERAAKPIRTAGAGGQSGASAATGFPELPLKSKSGRVELRLTVDSNLTGRLSADGSAIVFSNTAGSRAVTYRDLVVHDAKGRPLPSSMDLRDGDIVLSFNDAGAQYPITIDPLIVTEQAKLADGLLLDEAASFDYFGHSVAIDDDTVVVGADSADINASGPGSAFVFVRTVGDWSQVARLTASDAAEGDNFGCSVSISGDAVVVGAELDDDAGAASGSAYVFVSPAGGWTDMTETAKLTASDALAGDHFGESVSISLDTVVVGAYRYDGPGADSGSAYVFVKPGGGWTDMTEMAKLTASDAAGRNRFGISVSIAGDTVVAGAHLNNNAGVVSGAAYVFVRPGGGWADTTETAKLTASDAAAGDNFGWSVSISAGAAVVGAFGDDDAGDTSGSAYVFVQPAVGWTDATEDDKIAAALGDIGAGDQFGYSVSVSGDTAVVGLLGDDDNGSGSGSAMVFVRTGSVWSRAAKLTASDAASGDLFGFAVSIAGDTVVVGAYPNIGAGEQSRPAYVFVKPGGGWTDMTETARLTASDGAAGDRFGHSVSISGDTVVVGAHLEDGAGVNSGSAYVFVKPGGGWVHMPETAKLTASDAAAGDRFGFAVSISGNTVVAGAHLNNSAGVASGAAYVFVKPKGGWADVTETAKLTASDPAARDFFGWSVSISAGTVVVGAYGNDDAGLNSGSAYVFTKPGGGWVDMTETARLTTSNAAAWDFFGRSVTISADTVVVGAFGHQDAGWESGSAYVFVEPGGGWADMTETAKLTAYDAAARDRFGWSVFTSADTVIVGAVWDDVGPLSNAGNAYVYLLELDTDGDGELDSTDTDDDNDGVLDGEDPAPLDPDICGDSDADSCDDCAVGTDDFGPLADNDPADDGTDTDGDGTCDAGDPCPVDNPDDTDGDGVCDSADVCPGFDDGVDPDGDGVPNGCDVCPGFDDTADADGDGLPDGCDACPDSDMTETIVIDSCDTGVGNALLDDGCTMGDLIGDCRAVAKNHGQFVSCVARQANAWRRQGLLPGKHVGRITRCAGTTRGKTPVDHVEPGTLRSEVR